MIAIAVFILIVSVVGFGYDYRNRLFSSEED